MPTAQLVHRAAPLAEYSPPGQTTHCADANASVVARAVPAAQFAQLARPVAVAYWPVAQAVHRVDPDDAAIVPAAQLGHTFAPKPGENRPATQGVHPSCPDTGW